MRVHHPESNKQNGALIRAMQSPSTEFLEALIDMTAITFLGLLAIPGTPATLQEFPAPDTPPERRTHTAMLAKGNPLDRIEALTSPADGAGFGSSQLSATQHRAACLGGRLRGASASVVR